MASQIVGVLSATALGDTDQESMDLGSWVANNATQYNFLNHQDVIDLAEAEKTCRTKGNCDEVKKEFDERSDANRERLKNCKLVGNCAQIRAEIDEGSKALGTLIEVTEKVNPGGSDNDLAYYYQTKKNATDWTTAGLNHLDQIGNLWVNDDGSWLTEAGVYLDQTGFNPFGINVLPGMHGAGEGGGTKVRPLDDLPVGGGGKDKPKPTPEWDNPVTRVDGEFGDQNAPTINVPAFFDTPTNAPKFITNGRINMSDLQKLVPPGMPDTFRPSATIADGSKFSYVWAGQKVEIKWHSPDLNAAANHPGSNSGSGWTAQIKIGKKLLGQDGRLYRKVTNVTHIPVDFK
ncbi:MULTISPECIES: hypothetical protein [unclassified Pseudomonas]|uniref:hypothetical protein n=1 Tax=unclassified Pseudomonas TaxID=196821 RepID=UPI0030D83D70